MSASPAGLIEGLGHLLPLCECDITHMAVRAASGVSLTDRLVLGALPMPDQKLCQSMMVTCIIMIMAAIGGRESKVRDASAGCLQAGHEEN